MAVTVEIPFQSQVRIPRDAEAVRAYLTDWEKSIPQNFPGLERFEARGNRLYHWEFEKLSYQNLEADIRLDTEMVETGPDTIQMRPAGDSPHQLSGTWTLVKGAGETTLELNMELALELPISRLMKAVAAPLARREIGKLLQKFLDNVAKNLS